ncbi:MAG: M3 family oligoendopeptidase [Chloroflexia bacterium]|nr:M3 family oligoendopeptidase [Chloroflexia bacterium]
MYPGPESSEYAASVTALVAKLDGLERLIGQAEALPDRDGPDVTSVFETLREEADAAFLMAHRNNSFLYGYISVDSRDRVAQAKMSELSLVRARFSRFANRFTAWLGTLDLDALIASSETAQTHAFLLRQAAIDARHQMEPAQEDLQAELTLSGGSAWSRLEDDITSQIMVPFENDDGVVEQCPMAEIRNLAMSADREVRRRAHETELDAWQIWQTPIAAALNGVKGEHATLNRRRAWDSILDQSLHQNHIDRQTLDAMMGAARDAFPDFRRYFQAKAKVLGVEKLAFYDLFAPLSSEGREWPWDEALDFVYEQFGRYSPKMRELAERAIAEQWVDAGSRPGKVGGAFCMSVGGEESRVLMNFTPAFDGVRTLAHELGHAYHNLCEADVTPWRRGSTPMTLAETASTFCETILTQAAIANGIEDERFAILEGSLQDAAQVVVDITSRFLFEQAVCARRPERSLSAEEFCELMLDAQRQTYGDGLDGDALHPWMWAAKGHYYSPSFAYYNYPYMFGLLFGLGLYAKYQEDPAGFRTRYDDLLASTGDADAATLAARFGFDIRSKDFWEGSLNVIREDIDTFVALVDRRLP